jgi:hypothetical protein
MATVNERNNLFWIFALLLIVVAPFVIIMTPMIISVTFYQSPNRIVFIPTDASMLMYVFAFVVVIVLLCAMYFSRSVLINIVTSIIAVVGFFIIFGLGVQNYVYLHQDYIEYNPLLASKVEYQWEDLAKVTHEMYDEKTEHDEKYIFEFNDGYTFEFIGSGLVDAQVKSTIYNKVKKLKVPYEEY